ncbi:hypothetical protein ACSQ67_008218 [Phaseolus vulgaris]
MVILSTLPLKYSAFLHRGAPFLPSKFPAIVASHGDVSLTPQTTCSIKMREKHANHSCNKFLIRAARNDHHLSYDGLPEEPLLLSLIKEVICQLKYVEWPSFSSTLRTAVLTLILVALLIVALSSVDSALCYLLALALRKKP